MTHTLKTWTEYYNLVASGNKGFEVRKNDRDFKTADKVILQDWNPTTKEYSGKETTFIIGFIIHGPVFGIKKGYCVFQLIEPTHE